MRKSFLLFATFLSAITLKAQEIKVKSFVVVPFKGTTGHTPPNGMCDSFNLYAANDWQAEYYKYRGGGSVFGSNNLNDAGAHILEDADYFDVSGSDYNYINGGLVYFAYANSDIPADLDKDLIFKIYDDAGGLPGTLLGSATLTLSQVHQDVLQGNLTGFTLPSSILLPSSKKFYVAVDHSNFRWNVSNHDSIALVATADNVMANSAFQYIHTEAGKQWYPVNDIWKGKKDTLEVSLFIFPFLSNAPGGCLTLPVSILNFSGNIKNNQAYLNWSTAAESNNKGFYVEKSKDGRNFTSIDFVNGAGNSTTIKNYSYVDILSKDMNAGTTWYRLKQVDLDGKFTYSNVLPLSSTTIVQWKLYPNPAKDMITVEMHLDASSTVSAQVVSRDGRVVLNVDKGILAEGTQQFYMDTKGLAKGTYVVRVKAGDKTWSQLIVKD